MGYQAKVPSQLPNPLASGIPSRLGKPWLPGTKMSVLEGVAILLSPQPPRQASLINEPAGPNMVRKPPSSPGETLMLPMLGISHASPQSNARFHFPIVHLGAQSC